MSINNAWNHNELQFCRLLSEIAAVGLTNEQMKGLCESMDLQEQDIYELLDRAQNSFEQFKEEYQL